MAQFQTGDKNCLRYLGELARFWTCWLATIEELPGSPSDAWAFSIEQYNQATEDKNLLWLHVLDWALVVSKYPEMELLNGSETSLLKEENGFTA